VVAAGCGRSGSSSSTATTSKTGSAAAAAPSGTFGTLKDVCGPGKATGATDVGVTDTSINVSTMSDPGFTGAPGLNQEIFDAADAFVGWCNAAGGILGRRLDLVKRDAALTQVAARMAEACARPDFMLVGNGEGLDATGVQQRLSCKLPEIAGYDVSAAAGTAPLSLDPLPVPDAESNMGGMLRALAQYDPAAIKHYGLISSNQQSIRDSGNRDRAAAEHLGYVTVNYQEMPPTVDNWRPYVENAKGAGVEVLGFQGAPATFSAFLKTAADVGWFPKWVVLNGNNYDPSLISLAGTALDQLQTKGGTNGQGGGAVIITAGLYPFELASQNPATQLYINNLDQYVHGVKPKSLGINSTSAWLLFAESAKACGSNLTRDCVMSHAAAETNWTAGGLHVPEKPSNATGDSSQCFTMLKASSTGYTVDTAVLKPNSQGIYNCNPANVFRLPGFPQSS
jgi:ABC-type branched-subunit amino acid transport system substrate-binding protein